MHRRAVVLLSGAVGLWLAPGHLGGVEQKKGPKPLFLTGAVAPKNQARLRRLINPQPASAKPTSAKAPGSGTVEND